MENNTDIDWAAYFKSHGDFEISQMITPERSYLVAMKVQGFMFGELVTIKEVHMRCTCHEKFGNAPLAWEYEAVDKLRRAANELTGVAREAIMLVAKNNYNMELTYAQAKADLDLLVAEFKVNGHPIREREHAIL
ncbi:MAG: hypothetical protein ACTS9Y_00650 [Methylophilus sp.]|uniref:hypothetical protein n=1 Tax=Methylophilus sp. TaxID=29541 RepID=UPI003FA0A6B8